MIEYNGKKITAENITIEDIEVLFDFDKDVMLQHRLKLGNDYVDKQFPENIEQTSRVKKILARNIKLSDPKTFKDVKQPATYGKLFGDDPKNKKVNASDPNKKSAARFFKKPKPKTKDQVREERLEELRHLENTLSNK